MKNLIKFFGFAAFLAFTAAACGEDDPCADVECGTFGQCDGVVGVCQCDAGYEQDSAGLCEVLIRDKFIGTYAMSESCYDVDFDTTYTANYTFTASASSASVASMITQGWAEDGGTTITTSLDPGTTFTVDETTINVGGSSFSLRNASGSYNESTRELTLSYDLYSTTNNSLIYECTASGVKQ